METIDSLITARCRVAGPQVALRYKAAGSWQDFTYATLLQQLETVAAGLRQYGLQSGEHCALLAPASPWWVAAYLGVLRASGVVIPVDKELKAAELRHILHDSRTKMVFSEEPYLDTLLELAPDLPKLERIVLLQSTSSEESQSPKLVASLAALTDAWHALVQDRNIPPGEAQRLEELARSAYQAIVSPGGRRKEDKIVDFLAPTQTQRSKWQKSGRLLQLQQLQAAGQSTPAPPSHRNGDIAVDTDKAHASYREWMAKTRPAARHSPDRTRRPRWLPRPLDPQDGAYALPAEGADVAGATDGDA